MPNRIKYKEGEIIGNCIYVCDVEKEEIENKHRHAKFICKYCNSFFVSKISRVKSFVTKSCGCLNTIYHFKKHGFTGTKEYNAWGHIISKCKDLNDKIYGGRGISVCERWRNFENFLKDMGFAPSKKHSIDRINVNGNYEPSNCRWTTSKVQNNNRRNNIFIEFNGKRKTLKEWSEELNMRYNTLQKRYVSGWDFNDILTIPINKRK